MRHGKLIEGHPASYWERKSGIPMATIYMRYYRLKWPLEKILSTPAKSKGIDFEGYHYKSLEELCNVYGKKMSTVQNRMRKGLSLKDALCIDSLRDANQQIKQLEVCGHADCFTCPYHDCIYPDY